MLAEKVEKHHANVWLINTGWSGGKYGVGKGMSLKITRQIIDEIHNGALEKGEFVKMPVFNLSVPKSITGVDSKILMPINTWSDKDGYNALTKKLAG